MKSDLAERAGLAGALVGRTIRAPTAGGKRFVWVTVQEMTRDGRYLRAVTGRGRAVWLKVKV